ncbi:MAG TPA: YdcF family protein [Vicinamibacterales bacterium]|nr:YdcF family protein [Vicinamibacterales bacterium]
MRLLVRRTLLAALLLTAAAAGWLLVYGGRYLQHEDPLQRADAIFVLGGTRVERWLEAYELYRAGYAPVIFLSPERAEPGEMLIRTRGVRFPSTPELQQAALVQMGVPPAAIHAPAGWVDNTAQEGSLLRTTAQARGWKRLIVVTSKYHTRRSGFAVRRALKGTGTDVIMRASRYDPADPARWWRTRADLRFAGSEWIKLVLYRLGLAG